MHYIYLQNFIKNTYSHKEKGKKILIIIGSTSLNQNLYQLISQIEKIYANFCEHERI